MDPALPRGSGRWFAGSILPAFHGQTKRRLPRAPRWRLCADGATRASRSRAEVGISPSTVSRVLQRLGLNRLSSLGPAEPVRRYEREKPGELIRIDIKKLGQFNRIGHRITRNRPGQSNNRGVWLGVRPRRNRQPFGVSRSPKSCPAKEKRRHRSPSSEETGRLLRQPRRQSGAGDDRQRSLL